VLTLDVVNVDGVTSGVEDVTLPDGLYDDEDASMEPTETEGVVPLLAVVEDEARLLADTLYKLFEDGAV
jgi:hypothetical protein